MKPTRVTAEEMAWTQAQSVAGSPSLSRLAAALRAAGWEPLELVLINDRESVNFRLWRGDHRGQKATDREDALRTLIRAFRQGGFCVGFTEVAIDAFDGEFLTGGTLVGPLEQICEHGPVQVEP
jgi:hypothetical protein